MTRYETLLIVILSGCLACEDDANTTCKFADLISVQSGCYDSQQGLVLSATGDEGTQSEFKWEIHVLKDTTIGWTPADVTINEVGSADFTIPGDILLANQQVVANVMTKCGDESLSSIYFRFFKITSNNCSVWTER